MKGLTPGRIVHYVGFIHAEGETPPHIAAIVTGVDEGRGEEYAFLTLFETGKRAMPLPLAVCHSDTKESNTWHWVEPA